MITTNIQKIIRYNDSRATYTAYPLKKRKITGSTSAISTDTIEKNAKMQNKSSHNNSIIL